LSTDVRGTPGRGYAIAERERDVGTLAHVLVGVRQRRWTRGGPARGSFRRLLFECL
jgi:hypothetical protein